jgi:hypothetical protein
MVYTGHVENGAIVLDEPTDLPEGAVVKIELNIPQPGQAGKESVPTLAESLASVIGKAEGLPEDWSENHDKYLQEEHGR